MQEANTERFVWPNNRQKSLESQIFIHTYSKPPPLASLYPSPLLSLPSSFLLPLVKGQENSAATQGPSTRKVRSKAHTRALGQGQGLGP